MKRQLLIILLILFSLNVSALDCGYECYMTDGDCTPAKCNNIQGCVSCEVGDCQYDCPCVEEEKGCSDYKEGDFCISDEQCGEGLWCSGDNTVFVYDKACCPVGEKWDSDEGECVSNNKPQDLVKETNSANRQEVTIVYGNDNPTTQTIFAPSNNDNEKIIIIVSYNWIGNTADYFPKANMYMKKYLEIIPKENCNNTMKYIIIPPGDYGLNWKNKYCSDLKMQDKKCDDQDTSSILESCVKDYLNINSKYNLEDIDAIVGLTNSDLQHKLNGNCDTSLAGRSYPLSKVTISEFDFSTMAHELGHKLFMLKDQYCDCREAKIKAYKNFCGPHVNPSTLSNNLGCDADGYCCSYMGGMIETLAGHDPYSEGCNWCKGNLDRLSYNDQWWDFNRQRTLMSSFNSEQYDLFEYSNISKQLGCEV